MNSKDRVNYLIKLGQSFENEINFFRARYT